MFEDNRVLARESRQQTPDETKALRLNLRGGIDAAGSG